MQFRQYFERCPMGCKHTKSSTETLVWPYAENVEKVMHNTFTAALRQPVQPWPKGARILIHHSTVLMVVDDGVEPVAPGNPEFGEEPWDRQWAALVCHEHHMSTTTARRISLAKDLLDLDWRPFSVWRENWEWKVSVARHPREIGPAWQGEIGPRLFQRKGWARPFADSDMPDGWQVEVALQTECITIPEWLDLMPATRKRG